MQLLIEYDGIKLDEEEISVLSEFEKLLGKKIPLIQYLRLHDNETGYEAYKGHILKLIIYDEKLDSLPKNIENLKSLVTVTISRNNLTSMPEQFWNLKSIRNLDLSRNNLTSIPEQIGNLQLVGILDISHNELSSLPKNIGILKSLRSLDASYNNITSLPKSMENHQDIHLILEYNRLDDKITELDLSKLPVFIIDKNFLLNFNYYPSLYIKKEYNRRNFAVQKENFTILINDPGLIEYYWDYIITNHYDFFESLETIEWDFDLYLMEEKEYDFNDSVSLHDFNRSRISRRGAEDFKEAKNPSRKNNFVQFTLGINLYNFTPEQYHIVKYLFPLIKNIIVTVKTDRGDLIPLTFTDFYCRKTIYAIIDKPKELFLSTSYLKFDPEYKMEPYARLIFTDIKVEYEKLLILNQEETNIHDLTRKVDKLISLVEKLTINTDNGKKKNPIIEDNDSDLLNYEERQEFNKKVMNITNKFRSGFREPLFLDIILEMGNKISGRISKLVEYLAAGIIFASSLPGLFQFLLSLRFNFVTGTLEKTQLPVLLELITYIPLAFLIIYLIIKFLFHQRVPKQFDRAFEIVG